MKYLRKGLIGLAVLLLAAALLLWFLPARWMQPRIEARLHGLRLAQVQGLLWDGRAGQVLTADGRVLGSLRWRLSRRALLGEGSLQLDFSGPQLGFAGAMRQLPDGRVEWHAVTLHAALAALQPRLTSSLGQPGGTLQLTVAHALLQGGWPLQLQATAQWRHAVMQTRAGALALGELQAQAQAQGGVIHVQLRDDRHGPLQVQAQALLSPLGWRLDATLRARQTDPALRRWLSTLGPADADGTVRIHRRGGLAASLPDATPTTNGNPHAP